MTAVSVCVCWSLVACCQVVIVSVASIVVLLVLFFITDPQPLSVPVTFMTFSFSYYRRGISNSTRPQHCRVAAGHILHDALSELPIAILYLLQ